MQQRNEYNLCGVLVHARPGRAQMVAHRLVKEPGVEVHHISEDDRLVITVEHTDRRRLVDTIAAFHDINGVLSAAVIYQFNDEIEPEQAPARGEMPA